MIFDPRRLAIRCITGLFVGAGLVMARAACGQQPGGPATAEAAAGWGHAMEIGASMAGSSALTAIVGFVVVIKAGQHVGVDWGAVFGAGKSAAAKPEAVPGSSPDSERIARLEERQTQDEAQRALIQGQMDRTHAEIKEVRGLIQRVLFMLAKKGG